MRSLSGVVNVSVLTKPYNCPGECIYCPKETNIPKSYLSGEPAVERAKKLKYDPYLQVKNRIESLQLGGHPTDKIEVRIIGGNWSSYPKRYKEWFVKRCFEACNNRKDETLKKAQKRNETAKHRVIGMSFETRPDFINQKEIEEMLLLGATKIEIGVQSIYNDVLILNKRGHLVEDTIRATEMLKNAGFKVSYQVMLNLPGSNPQRDIEMFKELFSNPDFKPDYLKIYPCALVKEAPLYNLYLKGKYKPYTKEVLIETIKEIKKHIPIYVRIERIIRDIPSPLIVEGEDKLSNLRQFIDSQKICKCIRCREIKDIKNEEVLLFREDYDAKAYGIEYNPTEAKKLFEEGLKELGMTASSIGTIKLLSGNSDVAQKEAQFYQEQLKVSLGLNIQLEPVTQQIRVQRMSSKDFQIVLAGWGPDYNDPMTYLDLWLSTSGQNNSNWASKDYDTLIAQAKVEADPAKRMDILAQAEKLLMEELPIVPTFFRQENALIKPNVKGVVNRALSPETDFRFASME